MLNQHSPARLALTRQSHHDGPEHIVQVDAATLRPLSCTCLAGQHGRLCWAVIDVTQRDLTGLAKERWQQACGMDEIAEAARVLAQVRRWAAAARELAALRSCGYRVTAQGRAASSDAVAAS